MIFLLRTGAMAVLLSGCAALAACGADTWTAATSEAAAQAAAARQAKEQEAQIQAQIRAMEAAERKRVESVSEQADGASR